METQISTPTDLAARILELKVKVHQQELAIKDQASQAIHSLSPGNLLKNGLHKIREAVPLNSGTLVEKGLGMGVDLLARKFLGPVHGPVKKLALTALDFGVKKVLGNKSDTIKAYSQVILNRIINGNKNQKVKQFITKPNDISHESGYQTI